MLWHCATGCCFFSGRKGSFHLEKEAYGWLGFLNRGSVLWALVAQSSHGPGFQWIAVKPGFTVKSGFFLMRGSLPAESCTSECEVPILGLVLTIFFLWVFPRSLKSKSVAAPLIHAVIDPRWWRVVSGHHVKDSLHCSEESILPLKSESPEKIRAAVCSGQSWTRSCTLWP